MKNKLLDLICEIRPEIEFDPDIDFALHGVLDSLDIVLLVDSIESEFDITLDANDITPEVFASFSSLLAQLNRIC